MGRDLHASAIIGAQNLDESAADFGIDAGWIKQQDTPQGSQSAKALDPTAVVINSEHVSFGIHYTSDFGIPSVDCCKACTHEWFYEQLVIYNALGQ